MKSTEELYSEIEKLKEVNLVDFVCCTAGFRVDEERTKKENSNSANPKYIFVENNEGDKLLISRIYNEGKQQYLYKNLYSDLDKGNIISFIKHRTKNFSIPTAKKKIATFEQNLLNGFYKSTGVKIELTGDDIKTNTETAIKEMQRRYQVLPDFTKQEYLKSRGLSPEILNSHLCKGRIKNEYIYYPRISSATKPAVKHINTVFPIYGSDGTKTFLCGFVRKNENLKVTAKDSKQSMGVWSSDFRRGEPVTHLVISENPIDSLSYCQLKIDYNKSNPMLVASNGELTKSQLELYQEMVSRLRPETIVLANDNNCKGQLFSCKVLALLGLPDSYQDKEYYDKNKLIIDAEILPGYKDKYTGEIIWKFEHNKSLDNMSKDKFIVEHIPQFQRVVQYYERANKDLYLVNDEKYPFKIEKVYHDFNSQVKVSFHNSKDNWIEVNKSILSLKFDYTEHLQLEVPQQDDFNEDLKESLGIGKYAKVEVQSKKQVLPGDL
jgi:hypothetical protein